MAGHGAPRTLGVSNARVIERGRRFQVVRGRWGENGAPVVAKRAMTPDAAEGLRREYRLLRRVEGPGVAKALALQEENGHPLLVLEDAGPEDLKAGLAHGPLPLETFLHIAVRLAEILGRVHDASIVHRNVCPKNVVIRAPHEPTLVDFDLATDVVTVVSPRPPEQLEPTLDTISPEQTGRLNRVVDARSDLYSLGATFYEMLIGAPPFMESSATALVQAHLTRAPAFVSDVAPQVPSAVASIVERLLAKLPEDRYQTAAALADDLRTARTQWYAHRSVEPFELGVLDRVRVLALPETLYARDAELRVVRHAMRRTRAGSSELVMILGEPGAGKTALLDEIAARMDVPVLRGQFGEPGGAPYSALAKAFGARLEAIAREPLEGSSRVRRRIAEELGSNAAVLAQVLPELRWVLGAMPPPSSTSPAGNALRFRLTFAALVRALAQPECPLVLLIDDAQSADSASIEVLRAIARSGVRHMLLVIACRPGCADPGHPLTQLSADAGPAGTNITTMMLGPFTRAEVSGYVAAALGCAPADVEALAELVFRHSAGVPLYVRSVLSSLHDAGLLVHDDRRGVWEWDLRKIAALPLPVAAVDVLVTSIRRLPQETQDTLAAAACIGRSFELGTLAKIESKPIESIARRIWPAVRCGILLPGGRGELPRARTPVYRFVHERAQQAAYELIPAGQRSDVHVGVASVLLEDVEAREEELFAIVEQLERGADRLISREGNLELSALELRAGRRARASVAYGPALSYFLQGIEHLPDDAWRTHRDLAFDLHRDAAECCYVVGDRQLLDLIVTCARSHRLSMLERSELATLQVAALTQDAQFDEAVERGREGLDELGVALPANIDEATLSAELDRADAMLRAIGREALLNAPRIDDPLLRAKSTLIAEVGTALFFVDPDLSLLADVLLLPATLPHGTTAETSIALIAVARYRGVSRGDWTRADELADLALELARRAGDRGREGEALTNVGSFIQPWHAPLRSVVPLLRRAFEAGVVSGGMTFAAYARTAEAMVRFAAGEPLATVEVEAEAARELAQRVGNPIGEMAGLLTRQQVRCLRGVTTKPFSLDDADYEDEVLRPLIERNPLTAHYRHLVLLQLAVFFGRFDEAREHAAGCERYAYFVRGMINDASARFFGAIANAASADPSLDRLRADHAALAGWARGCPENFGFMERAVAAEIARLEGRVDDAFDLADQSIEAAAEQRATQFEALICERAAAHQVARGRGRGVTLYLGAARDAYARWGATAKVRSLDAELPAFALAVPTREARSASVAAIELSAVQFAAEQIVSALEWEPLLDRILAATRDLAGATRAALVLAEEGRLVVRGTLSEGALRATALRAHLDDAAPLAVSPVELAWRTGEPALIADARDASAPNDAYLESHDVRSIVAVPVQRQAVRIGVLYLEHRVSPRAFDAEQIAALTLLAAHITTALENSLLFDKLRHEIDERRRVEERVRFLADASMALAESLEYVSTLRCVARLSVHRVADWCAIDVVEEGALRRVAEAASQGVQVEDEGAQLTPSPSSPLAIAQGGHAVFVPEVSSEDLRGLAADDAGVARLRELGLGSLVSVPVAARGAVIGTISMASSRRRPREGTADLRLAGELAVRVALAIENARLYRAAREAVRLRDEFLSVASHELRGPLSALQLTLQALGSGMLSELPADVARPIAIAARQTLRLGRLVDELLDVSRMRAGKLHLRLERMSLDELVRDIAERFEGELAKAGCTLEVRVAPDVIGCWDPIRLGQVIENLITNAIKFGRGKPIHVRGEARDGSAQLVIRDHGVGIPTERIPFIFDRFERAVSPEHFGGLGLGLYIVREIVGALGGRVRVESVEGEGATFIVELPLEGPARAVSKKQERTA